MSSSTSSSSRPPPVRDPFGRYLAVLGLLVCLLIAQVWYGNAIADPYWYFGGNRTGGPSYAFKARDAKWNRLHANPPGRFDCLISGSSRAMTLDPNAFEGYRCFNFAAEAATLPESVALAGRFARVAASTRLVIQTVDNFDVEQSACELGRGRLAEWSGERRIRWLERYISIDVLRYARRIARGEARGIGYDARWSPVLDPFTPHQPDWEKLAAALAQGVRTSDQIYTNDCLDAIDELRAHFPEAQLTGYVSPISADLILRMFIEGKLAHHLDGMYEAASRFDSFYDFAIPSELTIRMQDTWDGSHYAPGISAALARTLLGGSGGPGISLEGLSREAYEQLYARAIRQVIDRHAGGHPRR